MYCPSAFREDSTPVLHEHIRAHPLATLVSAGPDGLFASHLPMMLDATAGVHGTLIGHVARANPHWRMFAAGVESLAVFHGPGAYVSPNWYPNKQATGRDVPTWNYVAVHVHGCPQAFEQADELLAMLELLTATHEAGMAQPWKVSDAPRDYISSMLGAIVGIRIPIARIEGKRKLSQNRNAADRAGAKAALAASSDFHDRELAALMPGA